MHSLNTRRSTSQNAQEYLTTPAKKNIKINLTASSAFKEEELRRLLGGETFQKKEKRGMNIENSIVRLQKSEKQKMQPRHVL